MTICLKCRENQPGYGEKRDTIGGPNKSGVFAKFGNHSFLIVTDDMGRLD